MASPIIDVSGNGPFTGTGSDSTSISSGGFFTSDTPNGVLVGIAYTAASAGTECSSISYSGSGLTFNRFFIQQEPLGSEYATVELWYAQASGSLGVQTVTANMSGTISSGSLTAAAISGAFSSSNPFDSNGALPAVATVSSSSPPTATFSTTEADDLLLFWSAGFSGTTAAPTCATPSGWAKAVERSQNSVNPFESAIDLQFNYKSVSSAQTGATVADASANSALWIAVVTAVTADATPIQVDLTGVASAGDAGTLVAETDITLTGASATGQAATVAGGILVVTGVSATGTPGAITPSVAADPVGAFATGDAFEVSGNNYTIQGVSAAAEAAQVFSPVLLVGVFATGEAALTRTPEQVFLPVFSIMTNEAVAKIGAMSNEPVAVIGSMIPSGPEQLNTQVFAQGVFATCATIALWPSLNLNVKVTGVIATSKANVVATS